MIHTTKGDIDETLLEKTSGTVENDNESTTWTEYRFIGDHEIIRRDVHVQLKKTVGLESSIKEF